MGLKQLNRVPHKILNNTNQYIKSKINSMKNRIILLLIFLSASLMIKAQVNNCITGCNTNTFVNSSDPNTLEYDNLISGFHASIVKEANGDFKIWGQHTQPDGTTAQIVPTVIAPSVTASNNYNYQGAILKAAIGSTVSGGITIQHQFAVLTTVGLYIWGTPGVLVSTTIKSTASFNSVVIGTFGVAGVKADGLPNGVSPSQVKMMFGSYGTLAIVTCDGAAWILTHQGGKKADGTNNNNNSNVWHRVYTAANTPLDTVVAMRGTPNAMIALTTSGEVFTWGTGTYINSGGATNRSYATQITLPSGVTPRMIGMTQSSSGQSYYLLSTANKLYSMGRNDQRQLGIWSTTDTNFWARPKKPNAAGTASSGVAFDDVAWFSPNEHDGYEQAAINIITTGQKLYAWGSNSGLMIGGASGSNDYDPIYMPGASTSTNGLDTADRLVAVETGGHTSVNYKMCSQKFGYVGHKTQGSMGDGSPASTNTNINVYSYATANIIICGAPPAPVTQDLKICPGTYGNLANALLSPTPPGAALEWWTDSTRAVGTQVADPSQVLPNIYFAFYIPIGNANCPMPIPSNRVTVSYKTSSDPGFYLCEKPVLATDDINQVPKGQTATGKVLSNDKGITLTVQSAQFINASGAYQTLSLGSATNVYNAFGVLAGSMTLSTNGTYTFVPTSTFVGEVPLRYTASDVFGNLDTTTLSIKVLPITNPMLNYPPIAQNDAIFTDSGAVVTSTLLNNDSDPNGDVLTVVSATLKSTSFTIGSSTTVSGKDVNGNPISNTGSLTLNANGSYTFTPTTGFYGKVDSITYVISDGAGGYDTANIYIDVLQGAVNNHTFANDDAKTAFVDENISGNVLNNDTDPESNMQTVTAVSVNGTPITIGNPTAIPSVGTITLNSDGTYLFDPLSNFIGSVTVGYKACDNATPAACDTANLYLTSVPELPLAKNDINQTQNGKTVNGNLLINDTYRGTASISNAQYYNATGTLTPITIGTATVIYNANGGQAGTITVNSDGTYSFVPYSEFTGEVPIHYTLSNSYGTSPAKLSIEVIKVSDRVFNDPPIAINDEFETETFTLLTSVNITRNDSDPDVDNMSITAIKQGATTIVLGTSSAVSGIDAAGNPVANAGTFYINTSGQITFTSDPTFVGTINPITYTLSDGKGGIDTAQINIKVHSPSRNHVFANDDARAGNKGLELSGNVIDNDHDPEANNMTVTSASINGSSITIGGINTIPGVGTLVLTNTGAFGFTPTTNFVGTIPVQYTVCDNATPQACDVATLYLTSLEITPLAKDDIAQTSVGIAASGTVLTNDNYGSTGAVSNSHYYNASGVLTPLILSSPTSIYTENNVLAGVMTLNSNGTYSFVPDVLFTGNVPVYYTLTDDGGKSDAKLTISVSNLANPLFNAPVALNDVVYTIVDSAINSTLFNNDYDVDNDSLGVVFVEQNSTIISVGTATIVSGKDVDGNPVANAGSIIIYSNGKYKFIPTVGFTGTIDSIIYTIQDINAAFDDAALYITVLDNGTNGQGNHTFANDDANAALMGVTMSGNVLINDYDPQQNSQNVGEGIANGTPLIIGTATTIPGVGNITLNSNGTYTFIPLSSYLGNVSVIYKVCDNGIPVACDNATLLLSSIDALLPDAKDDIHQIPSGVTANGNVFTNDLVYEVPFVMAAEYYNSTGVRSPLTTGTSTTVYTPTGVLAGTITLNNTGSYSFAPATNFTGLLPIHYTLAAGGNDTATIYISVESGTTPSVNDKPIAQEDVASTKMNITINSTVLANDSDPDADLLNVATAKQGATSITLGTAIQVVGKDVAGGIIANAGMLTINANGTYTFVPATGFVGTVDAIQYAITDGNGGADTALLNLRVFRDYGNVTYANDDANAAPKGTTMSGNVLNNDTDPEANTQTVSSAKVNGSTILTIGTNSTIIGIGDITLNANGTYTFIPDAAFVGTVVVEQEVCDNAPVMNTCSNATLYLTSLDVSASIIATTDIFRSNGFNGSTTASVLNNDSLFNTLVVPSQVILTPGTSPALGIVMQANGTIVIAHNTPVGTYAYPYTICQVTATANCDADTAYIIVFNPAIKGDSIVCIGNSLQLTGDGFPALVNPWVSNNTSIATISSTGIVTTVTSGTVLMTYTDDSGYSNAINVYVKNNPIMTGSLQVCLNTTATYTADSTPTAVSPWFSSNTGVASISSNGNLSALNVGNTMIIYTDKNGCADTNTINIEPLPTVNAGMDITICQVDTAFATAFVNGASSAPSAALTSLVWSTYNGTGVFANNSTISDVLSTTTYKATTNDHNNTLPGANLVLTATDTNSCVNRDTIRLNILTTYTWSGITSEDFGTASNWLLNCVPPQYATINFASTVHNICKLDQHRYLTNITNDSNAVVAKNILDLNGYRLSVVGQLSFPTATITGKINAEDGLDTMEFLGVSPYYTVASNQVIPTNLFTNKTVANLRFDNAAGVTEQDSIFITHTVQPINGNYNTGQSLTLRSTALLTARVTPISNTTTTKIIGNVVIERYIPSGNNRAWRLLSAAIKHTPTTQTIFESWQENMRATTGNYQPGYGTYVSRINAGITNGYDSSSNTNSLRYYDGFQWVTPLTTNDPTTDKLTDWGGARFLFIRGDKTILPDYYLNPNIPYQGVTTLRQTGEINQGTVTVGKEGLVFSLIPNPYASPIDLDAVGQYTANNQSNFFVWDATLNSIGGFRTLTKVGSTYIATPSTGSSTDDNNLRYLQSGQAFMIADTIQLTFNEDMKADNLFTHNVYKSTSLVKELVTELYNINTPSVPLLVDGTRIFFDSSYNNNYAASEDVLKLTNNNECLAIGVTGKNLVISKQQEPLTTDTIQMKFWQTTLSSYRLTFNANNFGTSTTAVLIDQYTNTVTPLSNSNPTNYDFTVTSATGSWNINRFIITLTTNNPLSMAGIQLSAVKKNEGVKLQWQVNNQKDIVDYHVERSEDGKSFENIQEIARMGGNESKQYTWIDVKELAKTVYYRIKGVSANNDKVYSNIALMKPEAGAASVSVYPNPTANKSFSITMHHMIPGTYAVEVYTEQGQKLMSKTIQHVNATASYPIAIDKAIVSGNYMLKLTQGPQVLYSGKLIIE